MRLFSRSRPRKVVRPRPSILVVCLRVWRCRLGCSPIYFELMDARTSGSRLVSDFIEVSGSVKVVSLVLVIIILLIALSFSAVNAHVVKLNYYVGSVEAPLALVLVSAFTLGALFALAAMVRALIGLRLDLMRVRKTLKQREQELANIRSISAGKTG